MKYCSYCEKPITGEATSIPDAAANGAHLPAYWHANRSECGPRRGRTSEMDDSSPLRDHLTQAGWRP